MMADGEKVGTWGQITNRNLGQLLEQALAGTSAIAMSDATYTLAQAYGTTTGDEARSAVLAITGTLTANRSVIMPTSPKIYIVMNATSGGHSLLVGMATGTKATVPNGVAKMVICDGTNCWALDDAINVQLAVIDTAMIGEATIVDLTVTDDTTIGGDLTVTGTITGTVADADNAAHLEDKTLSEIKAEIATDYDAAIAAAIADLELSRDSVVTAINEEDVDKPGIKDIVKFWDKAPVNGTFSVIDFGPLGVSCTEIDIIDEVGTGPGTIVGSLTDDEFSVTITGATEDSANFKSTLHFWRTV
jgi:hypothetical protein